MPPASGAAALPPPPLLHCNDARPCVGGRSGCRRSRACCRRDARGRQHKPVPPPPIWPQRHPGPDAVEHLRALKTWTIPRLGMASSPDVGCPSARLVANTSSPHGPPTTCGALHIGGVFNDLEFISHYGSYAHNLSIPHRADIPNPFAIYVDSLRRGAEPSTRNTAACLTCRWRTARPSMARPTSISAGGRDAVRTALSAACWYWSWRPRAGCGRDVLSGCNCSLGWGR